MTLYDDSIRVMLQWAMLASLLAAAAFLLAYWVAVKVLGITGVTW
jgi:hypothetical protein